MVLAGLAADTGAGNWKSPCARCTSSRTATTNSRSRCWHESKCLASSIWWLCRKGARYTPRGRLELQSGWPCARACPVGCHAPEHPREASRLGGTLPPPRLFNLDVNPFNSFKSQRHMYLLPLCVQILRMCLRNLCDDCTARGTQIQAPICCC